MSNPQRIVILKLLEKYREFRCLWDIKHPKYFKRLCREKSYIVLLKIYQQLKPDSNLEDLKKKIDNMRSAYRREFRKLKESGKAGSDQIYIPTLWYFKHLSFLDGEVEVRSHSIDTEDDEDSFEPENVKIEWIDDTSSSASVEESKTSVVRLPTPPPQATSRKRHYTEFQEENEDSINNRIPRTEDDCSIIARSWAVQMRNLNQNQQTIAQKLVADIIFYGTRNKLTDSSSIIL